MKIKGGQFPMVIRRGGRREHLIYENKEGQFPMVIGRGRRREKKNTGKQYEKKVRIKKYWKKLREKKLREKSRDFWSLTVKHAQWSDPPHRSHSNMT